MVDFRQVAKATAKQFACNAFSAGANTSAYIGDALNRVTGVRGVPNGTQATYEHLANLACDAGGASGGGSAAVNWGAPGLPPGQCPGVPYRIEGQARVFQSTGAFIRSYNYLTFRSGPLPRFGLQVTPNNVLVVDENGDTLANLGTRPSGGSYAEWLNDYPTITRNDGSAAQPCDNGTAGDDLPRQDIDITYDDSTSIPITDSVVLIGGELIIDNSNNLTMPITLVGPTYEFGLNYDFSRGDVDISFGGDNGPGGSNCCPTVDPPELENDDTDDDPPPPDDDRRFTGVIVRSTVSPNGTSATEVDGGGNISLFIPRIVTISFAIENQGKRFWTIDYPVKKLLQLVEVPHNMVAYDYAIYTEGGVTAEVKPLYIKQN